LGTPNRLIALTLKQEAALARLPPNWTVVGLVANAPVVRAPVSRLDVLVKHNGQLVLVDDYVIRRDDDAA
jgi:hypothetical protein